MQGFASAAFATSQESLAREGVVTKRALELCKSGCIDPRASLPELVDFKLFGKTILVVNTKFKLFVASQLGK